MDRLSPFFSNFTLSAKVFFSGRICGTTSDHATRSVGHIHVLRSGVLSILDESGDESGVARVIREPTVLLYAKPGRHTFQTEGAEIVCAFVDFGAGTLNPLLAALPPLVCVPLSAVPGLAGAVDLLFAEAFDQRDGRQAAVDRLAEYFLLLLLRSAIDTQLIQGGIVAALADKHLSRALAEIHEQPARAWTLEEMAHVAGMSRARFAAHFLATMGKTPFEYLALWRVGVAQSLLKRGEPLKMVAPSVGYASAGALSRAFSLHAGLPPMAWLAAQGHAGDL